MSISCHGGQRPLPQPVEAVILALDPSKSKSGAVVMLNPQKVVLAARARKQAQREFFVRQALYYGAELNLPVVVVAEEWDPPRHRRVRQANGSFKTEFDQKWTFPAILGIGEGWGKWTAEFERHCIREEHVIRATPLVWRDDLFGKRRPRDTKGIKEYAMSFVKHRFQLELDDDSAEALCLGLWGYYRPEVAQAAASVVKQASRKRKS